jgi:hypothetical protein
LSASGTQLAMELASAESGRTTWHYEGLEELLRECLQAEPGLTEMFGGRAWLLNGNLLCGARDDGMLARLGKGNEDWALG